MSFKTAGTAFSSHTTRPKQPTKSGDNSFQELSHPEKPAPTKFSREKYSNYLRDEKKALSVLSQYENIQKHRTEADKYDDSADEKEGLDNEKGLREELTKVKAQLKGVSSKVSNLRKERDLLQKENKSLQQEVLTLQSSLRQMIPGFSNTGSTFPMFNELVSNSNSFYKHDCEDLFFDVLCPELNMKGIVLFYQTCFQRMSDIVQNYFLPSENTLKKTACLTNLEGPIMNVLRKSFQSTYRNILKHCFSHSSLVEITKEIQSHLGLGEQSQETNEQINEFLQKLGELLLCFYISDPPLAINSKIIGTKVSYSPLKHEALDGFIKAKDECIIILPSVHKSSADGELVSKALVLQVDYEIPN